MQAIEAVRSMVEGSTVLSQNKVAAALGMSPQSMSQRLYAKDVKAGFVADVADVLGYQLVLVPKGTRLPGGSIVIDPTKVESK